MSCSIFPPSFPRGEQIFFGKREMTGKDLSHPGFKVSISVSVMDIIRGLESIGCDVSPENWIQQSSMFKITCRIWQSCTSTRNHNRDVLTFLCECWRCWSNIAHTGDNGLYRLLAEVWRKYLNTCLTSLWFKHMLKNLCNCNQVVYMLFCWDDQ